MLRSNQTDRPRAAEASEPDAVRTDASDTHHRREPSAAPDPIEPDPPPTRPAKESDAGFGSFG